MKKHFWVILFSACLFSALAGCTTVRTYTVEEDRVDQDLASGNQGYMTGQASGSETNVPRKLTRKRYVAEVEVGKYKTSKKKSVKTTAGAVEMVQEPAGEVLPQPQVQKEAESSVAQKMTSYTVEPNDTLGKIAQKVYGKAAKWKKIFEANSDQLKSPDKIYAGQVLKIPQE